MKTTAVSMLNNDRAPGYWILLVGIPALLALAAMLLSPISAPQPAYLRYAQEYANTGRIVETVFPAEYSWFAGLSIIAFGTRGPEVLGGALYLLIAISVWALARKGGATARNALFAALAAAIYPRLIWGVTKVWDVELAVLLMVLLMFCTVSLLRHGLQPSRVVAIAVVFGFCVAQRSNLLLLFPLPIYFCFVSVGTWRRKISALLFGSVLSVAVFAAVNTLAHGSFFFAQNGPYNLVGGHNEYSREVMLRDMGTEPTVALIRRADGLGPVGEADEGDPTLQRYFMHRAFVYMRGHPLQEAELIPVKLWTVFRPDVRLHSGLSLMTVLIVCMSLILPAWLILLLLKYTRTGFDSLDWTFIAAVVLYILPFLLTACDPRHQMPIEICLLSHIACMVGKASRKAALTVEAVGTT